MYNLSSVVDEKLSNPNYCLEDLLDDDEIMIQELKCGNTKLINL